MNKPQSLGKKNKVNMQRLSARFRSQQCFWNKICEDLFYPTLVIIEIQNGKHFEAIKVPVRSNFRKFVCVDFSKVYVAVTYHAKPFFNPSTSSPFFFFHGISRILRRPLIGHVPTALTCDQASLLFFQGGKVRLIQLLDYLSVASPESGLFSDWSRNKGYLKQNKISVSLACHWHMGSKSTNYSH